mmetsp:Transcript_27420/g.53903  ORF Transcript_27420/g.53903 Transcript_27420/m.53903 type:complete len:164 (+) Transcript_27420:680-1171(+)
MWVCSLSAQPNDLMRSHFMLHAAEKNPFHLRGEHTDFIEKQWGQVVSQQLSAVRLPGATLKKLGELFRCCSKTPEAFARQVVRAGHMKAEWGHWDDSVDFQAMLQNYQFYKKRRPTQNISWQTLRFKGTHLPRLLENIAKSRRTVLKKRNTSSQVPHKNKQKQ